MFAVDLKNLSKNDPSAENKRLNNKKISNSSSDKDFKSCGNDPDNIGRCISSQQFTLTGSMNSQKMARFSGEKTLIVDTELTKTLNMPGMASLQSHNGYLCHFEIANS
jgi:hypothetical protein